MDPFSRLMLRAAAAPTAVVGVVTSIIASFFGDTPALVGGLLGTVVVCVFFMLGQGILAHVLRTNPMMGMSVALALYIAKIIILLVLLLLLADVTAFDTKAFALTILICTLTWTVCEVFIFSRTRVLVVDPDNVPPAAQELHEIRESRRREE